MEMNLSCSNYNEILEAVKAIKEAVLLSRYRAAKLANREQLSLYFNVGEYISTHSRTAKWGSGAIAQISQLLQKELPGLRGFSESGIKRMRTFYEGWCRYVSNRPMALDDLNPISLLSIENRPMVLDDFTREETELFMSIGFSHHYDILIKTESLQERLYYIRKCATEFWSVDKLRHKLKSGDYKCERIKTTSFATTIPDPDLRGRALNSFKDEYLLDFINVEDPDAFDEKILEQHIVHNIKNFILAFGKDFTYMGNQYRVIIGEKEFFIDLLFFHRGLRCLVAVELKKGEYKAEYASKMNLYLSALDEYVKNPDENPSIGIILCKDKDEKIVHFSFRNILTPMGVATYKTADELPPELRKALPDPEKLRELL